MSPHQPPNQPPGQPPGQPPQPPRIPDYFPGPVPQFAIGQIVQHRRYGYRGVVVDFDLTCQADERWYRANQTQPARDQPWYHVLVDDSSSITYAAQTSLEPAENTEQPVQHPLVDSFFERREAGRYVRNDEAWPGHG